MQQTKKIKEDKGTKRFRTLTTFNDDSENYYFADVTKPLDLSFLKHDFDKFDYAGLEDYALKRKSQNITTMGNLGVGAFKTTVKNDKVVDEGKFGFDIIDINSQEIKDRYEWCYLMERLYLFKHMELLQLTINISYIINSLFIMYYLFSRIVKLREVGDQKCPIPRQVVLPPTYRQLIQNYFNTQRGDLNHINKQIKDTVVGIQKVLNS